MQLQQVVLNLLRNAMEAIVEARRTDGQWCIARAHPADRRHGRDQRHRQRRRYPAGRQIFEPLSTSKTDGLGLGLSICASIVQAHGGRIWLQSSRAGATEFRFSLPIRTREPDP